MNGGSDVTSTPEANGTKRMLTIGRGLAEFAGPGRNGDEVHAIAVEYDTEQLARTKELFTDAVG